jgi:hypothetical protein
MYLIILVSLISRLKQLIGSLLVYYALEKIRLKINMNVGVPVKK